MNIITRLPNELDQRITEANAIRARRRADEREAVDAERAANATPETIRHKQACVADSLYAKGVFTKEQQLAANEICEVFITLTSGLFAKSQSYVPRIPGSAKSDWAPGMVTAYLDRYVKWRDEAGALGFHCRAGRTTVADVVFLVAVDNLGLEQAANRLHVKRQRVLATVRESLYRYGELAGWYSKKYNE